MRTVSNNCWRLASVLLAGLALGGCKQEPTPQEVGKLATAYADVLLIQQLREGDSATIRKSRDSVLRHYGYDDEGSFMTEVKETGSDPEVMRKIFDSAQQRLQEITNAALPPPPTPTDSAKH